MRKAATPRQTRSRQLRRHEILAALLQSSDEGMWAMDAAGYLVMMNQAAVRLLGWTEGAHRGAPIHEMIHVSGAVSDCAPRTHERCPLLGVLQTGRHETVGEDAFTRRDGAALAVSYTATPILRAGQVRGAVVTFRSRGAPTPMEEQPRETEAQSQELLEQRVAERTRELSALLEVSHNVASTLELEPLLGLILDQLKQVVDNTGAAILIAEGEYLRTLGYRGPLPSERVVGQRFPIAEAPSFQEILRNGGRPTIVDDVWGDSPLARAYQRSRNTQDDPAFQYIRSLLVVPLMVKEQVIGAVRIDHSVPHAYTPHHATLALAFANQAAVAFENARLYGQAQEMAALEERARLARELHDSVTQALFSASLIAEVLPNLWARDADAGRQHLEGLRLLTRGALAEMRTLLLELRPAALLETELGDLLRQLIEGIMGRKRLAITLTTEGQRSLPPDVQIALYRIAQEALNNVMKHAGASTAAVSLQFTEDAVDLRVSDDGRGFDPGCAGSGHLGLRGMRERAKAIGATLRLESNPGQGAVVHVVWRDHARDEPR